MKVILLISFLSLASCQVAELDYHPVAGAEFRSWAKSFVDLKNPECPITEKQKYLEDFEQLDRRWKKLKIDLRGTSFAIDMAVVESDEEYERSQDGLAECISPDLQGSDRDIEAVYNSMLEALQNVQRLADLKPEES